MSTDRETELKFLRVTLKRLVRFLPAKTRALYGEELLDVYEIQLLECRAKYGLAGARMKGLALIADVVLAVCLEYIDAWRRTWISPLRFARLALVGAGAVWCLVAAASIGNVRWAAAILDYNLPVSLTAMLGLPALSLVASRVGAGPGSGPEERAVLTTSTAATVVAWSILTCHIAA